MYNIGWLALGAELIYACIFGFVLYMNGSPTTENICLGIVFVVWIYEWVRFSYWGNIWMVAGPVQTTVTPLYPMAAKKKL